MSSRFPRYPAYKESGKSWLGRIPSHWSFAPLKRFLELQRGHDLPSDSRDEGVYPIVSSAGPSGTHTDFRAEGPGIVTGRYGTIGDFHYVCGKYWPLNTALYSSTCRGNHARYLFYLLHCIKHLFVLNSLKAAVPGVDRNDVHREFVAAPLEIYEQTQIAKFLDYETAKIDALIEKQQQLIALLKEKRQAVISHAVTKGLDPNVPMRDSGVEWLGDVPAHWDVKKLRFFASILRGKFTHRPRNDPAFYDGEFPFIQTGEITSSSKYISKFRQTLNHKGASVSKEFPKGTLVMAIAANIGDVAILDFPAYFPDSIVGLLPNRTADVTFMFYMMQAMKALMLRHATISTQMNLNIDQISWLDSVCPPIKEQRAIARMLDELTAKIDILQMRATEQIDLLQEKRTALISAAVTGKIDVRGWTPPESADEADPS